jgi:hypothetical protein
MLTCDRCCAKALETWMHEVTGEILRFCAHHSRQFQARLYDQRFHLVEAEKVPG